MLTVQEAAGLLSSQKAVGVVVVVVARLNYREAEEDLSQ